MKKTWFGLVTLLLSFIFLATSIEATMNGDSVCNGINPQSDALLVSQYCSKKDDINSPILKDEVDAIAKNSLNGSVRIIIKIKGDFLPEGLYASESSRLKQRQSIRDVQEKALKSISNIKINKLNRFETIPFMAFETDIAGLNALTSNPNIVSIKLDKLSKPMLSQSVPIIQGDQAWGAGFSGRDWSVAVLDTGAQTNHPFLRDKIVSEACYSSGPTSLCPNGQSEMTGTGSSEACSGISGCSHGTHVSGIAVGKGDSFSGVAKDSKLISIQVFSRVDDSSSCEGNPPCVQSYDSDQITALERVYSLRNTYNISSANMSLGSGQYTTYCDADNQSLKAVMDNLRSVGIATVVASANDGYIGAISSPACISTAISVGSTTKDDAVSDFSNSASILSLLAPGSSIYSSRLNSTYGYSSGTSMATPHVAGAWALMKQKKPSATVTEVLNAFQSTGKAITDTRNGLIKSRINVMSALNSFVSTSSPVYRFFNTRAGGHFFTTSVSERDDVIRNYPFFNYEGIGFYGFSEQGSGRVPVYRFFNTRAGGHFFTTSASERDDVIRNYPFFNYENIGFYALP